MSEPKWSKQEILRELAMLKERTTYLETQLADAPDLLEIALRQLDDAQREMQLDELHYQKLVDTTTVGILVVNKGGNIVFANEICAHLFRYERSVLLGLSLMELIPPALRTQHETHIQNFFANPAPRPMGTDLDLMALRQDGTQFPVEINLNVLESHNEVLTVAFINDITELKRTKLNFGTIIDTAAIGILIINGHGSIVTANNLVAEMFGYQKQELLDQNVEILIPEELRERHGQHLSAYFKNPRPRPMGLGITLTGRKQDGKQFPVEISLSAIQSEDTHLSVAFIADLSKRKEAEDRFRTLIDTASIGIIIVQVDGRILIANQIAAEYFQYSKDELAHLALAELMPSNFRHSHAAHLQRFFQNPQPRPMGVGFELAAQKRDGTQFPVEISLSAVEAGSETLGVAFIADISERKKSEKLYKHIMQNLVSNISHDLKTPMTTIITRLHILQRSLDDDLHEYSNLIMQQVLRLDQLLENMLEITQLDTMQTIQCVETNLDELLHHIVAAKQDDAQEKAIQLTYHTHSPQCLACLDGRLIRKAMQHLIENAIIYTPAQGTIEVLLQLQDEIIEISVTDSGLGMTESELDVIFDPFYRGDISRQTTASLNGLGLSIVQRIVKLHHGTIEAQSQIGEGSRFIIRIPRVS